MAQNYKIYRYQLNSDAIDASCLCMWVKIKEGDDPWEIAAIVFRNTTKQLSRGFIRDNAVGIASTRVVNEREDYSTISTGLEALSIMVPTEKFEEIASIALDIQLEKEDIDTVLMRCPKLDSTQIVLLPD